MYKSLNNVWSLKGWKQVFGGWTHSTDKHQVVSNIATHKSIHPVNFHPSYATDRWTTPGLHPEPSIYALGLDCSAND